MEVAVCNSFVSNFDSLATVLIMFSSFLKKTRVSILKRISSVVSMLCLLSGLLLVVSINQWDTGDFDPNIVVFLVKVVFLL